MDTYRDMRMNYSKNNFVNAFWNVTKHITKEFRAVAVDNNGVNKDVASCFISQCSP